MKSNVAAKVVKAMNPSINIHPFIDGVELKNEHIYTDHFFQQLDGIVTALDNIKACKPLATNLRSINYIESS